MPLLLSIAAILQLTVVLRLWRIRLLSLFPFFAFHFFASAVWSIVSINLPRNSPWFATSWKVGAVITVCSLIAAFLETISRSLEHYPGQNTRVVLGACGIIAAVSAVLGAMEPITQFLRILLVVQRVSGVAVAVGAVALVVVLNFMDPRRRPNVVRHERLMAAMAANVAIAAWFGNHGYSTIGDTMLYAGNLIFPLLWIWALRPEGEIDPRPPADTRGIAQAEEAKKQLSGYYDD